MQAVSRSRHSLQLTSSRVSSGGRGVDSCRLLGVGRRRRHPRHQALALLASALLPAARLLQVANPPVLDPGEGTAGGVRAAGGAALFHALGLHLSRRQVSAPQVGVLQQIVLLAAGGLEGLLLCTTGGRRQAGSRRQAILQHLWGAAQPSKLPLWLSPSAVGSSSLAAVERCPRLSTALGSAFATAGEPWQSPPAQWPCLQ